MNRLKLAYRKLNLQVRQVNELRLFEKSNFSNTSRFDEQKKVLLQLLQPKVLFSMEKLESDHRSATVKYLNGLNKLASNDKAYNIRLNAFKS